MPDVIMPKMGDAMEEGKLLRWIMEDGAKVKTGDIIAEIETDKSNVEVDAEDEGVLRIVAEPGSTIPVGGVIATIGDATASKAASAPKPAASTPKPAEATPPQPTVPPTKSPTPSSQPMPSAPLGISQGTNGIGRERLKASPLARRIAREQGIDIAQVTGTGPLGRIVEADVLAFVGAQSKPRPSVAPTPAATPPPASVALSGIRKVIARRMVESKTTIPHFYITSEIDMGEAIALREKLNSYDDSLQKVSFNDMIVKASAKALAKYPAANAAFANDSIVSGSGVHVGIAVALDEGLIVPVIRDANKISLRRLAGTSKELIKKAREKKLQPSEYSGGTFTVSNLGMYDVENFIAIIDPSQGAILAVSSTIKKPVVLADGETIAVRSCMKVTFSGDHRVMDGAVGAQFLQELKRLLQNPLSLLEE